MDAGDAFILVVGLWVGAQAAAIGYGRGAATYTFAETARAQGATVKTALAAVKAALER